MPFRLAFEQPERTHVIGAHEVEKIGRGFRDTEKYGFHARKPAHEIADRRRPLRCEIGQPARQSLFGLVRIGHMRSVHEPRGQTILVRVALRG